MEKGSNAENNRYRLRSDPPGSMNFLYFSALGLDCCRQSPDGAEHNSPQRATVALQWQRPSLYCLRLGEFTGLEQTRRSWVPQAVSSRHTVRTEHNLLGF